MAGDIFQHRVIRFIMPVQGDAGDEEPANFIFARSADYVLAVADAPRLMFFQIMADGDQIGFQAQIRQIQRRVIGIRHDRCVAALGYAKATVAVPGYLHVVSPDLLRSTAVETRITRLFRIHQSPPDETAEVIKTDLVKEPAPLFQGRFQFAFGARVGFAEDAHLAGIPGQAGAVQLRADLAQVRFQSLDPRFQLRRAPRHLKGAQALFLFAVAGRLFSSASPLLLGFMRALQRRRGRGGGCVPADSADSRHHKPTAGRGRFPRLASPAHQSESDRGWPAGSCR